MTPSWSGRRTASSSRSTPTPAEHRPDERDVGISSRKSVIVCAKRPVSHDDQLRRTPRAANALECVDERREPVARIEPPEKQHGRHVGTNAHRPRSIRREDLRVDPVRDVRPLGIKVALMRFDDGWRNGDGGREAPCVAENSDARVADRIVEVCVKRTHHGALGFIHGEKRKRGRERRVDVHDVVCAFPEHVPHSAPQRAPNRYAGQRAVAVNRNAPSDTDHVRRVAGAIEVRRNDVDVMATKPRFAREKMNVFTYAAEVRIVVLRDLGDSKSVHSGWPGSRPQGDGAEAPVPNPGGWCIHRTGLTRGERNPGSMPEPTLTGGFVT